MHPIPIEYVYVLPKPDLEPQALRVLKACLQEAQMPYSLESPSVYNPNTALLCLGGDGTLLAALRHPLNLPCFGVHVGYLGFLTATNLEGALGFLKALKRGDYSAQRHLMLEGKMGKERILAANDLVVSKQDYYGMLELQLFIDGVLANTYKVDGLIFATPLGSTAYNISVGGSVLDPLCQNILITPIAAHSLSERPLILGARARLKVLSTQACIVVADGQVRRALEPKQPLIIQRAKRHATLLQPLERNYFNVLKEKFAWGSSIKP
ncbi:NAD(+)/NADH kinase [Helicobacter heilmannii]|uniref:NAD kinase n=1 Tax=Helicobacter heilmannii TaxID=35817 RepID=A0A0K2Y5G6_HELHE|nr:NAD(+)/NADH kinase [Helicobacter heilmannii]CCM11965.1 NAD kinase [Helicobacter heilmannii ASB1.4]CRF46169.1 NAD kinase [Helicobacter heilmannii]CRF47211.1 NAD kinase [Helicobacter heilmannii]CRF50788.1 NAD kinase [Helicobacter heilmannii]CRI34401.1 NAD kinase [Helicobacter heilmannii]